MYSYKMKGKMSKKYSHRCRKQIYGYWAERWGRGGGINWETGTDIYTLLYIKQIPKRPTV